ncbi:hypothetical protein [Natrinema limicola]|uniref:Uncharacterized protein n=1 Tax=Natrinema limicola JCM 13563 TaxID=1230457 RepID=M0CEX2_9EURY|nr:hypothetical protein [Natrinema limicola]ELZ21805.1 hypothetical protein C476_07358 [Natrinema limicola JCM 13563]
MASPPSISDQGSAGSSSTTESRDDAHGVRKRSTPGLVTSIRAMGFWTAIAMPFLYLPLLATGLSSSFDGILFVCLLVGNLLALYVGHPHHQ